MAAEDPRAVAAVQPSGERPIRAAEVVGALSLATDLGTGQPLEHALRTAVLAVCLGELAGASTQELVDTKANVGLGRTPEVRARLIEGAIANAAPRAREGFAMMCEVAQRFAGGARLHRVSRRVDARPVSTAWRAARE